MIKKENLQEFIKYALIGFSGIFVNLFFLYILTQFLHVYYLISEIFAFSIATMSNFTMNKLWTFRERLNDQFVSKGSKFFIVAGAALIVNIFFLWFFTEVTGIYYILSQILSSAFTLLTNFSGNKLWTFRKRQFI
jgi:dolichol-phosphate mannosyltransferase